MNIIMRNFYHPAKWNGQKVPQILGLTASPIMSANSSSLQTVESNLDAVAITPKKYRSDLETYVDPPQLSSVVYTTSVDNHMQENSSLCLALAHAVNSYDLSTDPWVEYLVDLGDQRSQRKLEEQVMKPDTYCYKQLKLLHQRTAHLQDQLGISMAEWYVSQCIQRFKDAVGPGTYDSLHLSRKVVASATTSDFPLKEIYQY